VPVDSLIRDIRYAVRGLRRSPLFASSVAATIGLGLGILCSAFTMLNAYFLRPIDLPDPHSLFELSWDTATVTRHRFNHTDFEEVQANAAAFTSLIASEPAIVMQDDVAMPGLLVTGNYFDVLGAPAARGRVLRPSDARAPGEAAVVVLSDSTWRARYGADPSIIGKQIALGRQRFEVVGITVPGFAFPGQDGVAFWAPLTMARAFSLPDVQTDPNVSLSVVGRLRPEATELQARAWLDVWLRQRFPAGSEAAPVAVRVESRATRLPLNNAAAATLLALIVSAFGLVLLVACANVTNLLLARAFGRQREIAVRLSLGASRWRVARQLAIESLVLAVPASAIGLGLTMVTARVFPALILSTFPEGIGPIETLLVPLDPDGRVMAFLFIAAVMSAVLVTLAPAVRVTRANLIRASKGESGMDISRSRLRTGLVAMQIGACVLFLVGAAGLIQESVRLADPNPRLNYERVSSVRLAQRLRADVATRLRSDPAVEHVAAAWQPPLVGPLPQIGAVASQTRIEQTVGFMVVSPDYFPMFDIRIVKGRSFTTEEADNSAPVALVSEATARRLWPGADPIGQTIELGPPEARRPVRRPDHASVRVIGVTADVVSGLLINGIDATCVYFTTGLRAPGELSILVRARTTAAAVTGSVTAAIKALEPEAPFQVTQIRSVVGVIAWTLGAFSAAAVLLGVVGLLLAFSGTYAVVAFLVMQRTREFGIRMALGATVGQIVSGMMTETLRIASIGLTAGVIVALALARMFSGTVPIIPAFSLPPYVIGTGIVLTATIVAALLPSLRTSKIDPSAALRVE